jgi:hypothetical protein
LEDPCFAGLLEVQACTAGLVDSRLRNDVEGVQVALQAIDPEAITLSVDIVGTDLQDEW